MTSRRNPRGAVSSRPGPVCQLVAGRPLRPDAPVGKLRSSLSALSRPAPSAAALAPIPIAAIQIECLQVAGLGSSATRQRATSRGSPLLQRTAGGTWAHPVLNDGAPSAGLALMLHAHPPTARARQHSRCLPTLFLRLASARDLAGHSWCWRSVHESGAALCSVSSVFALRGVPSRLLLTFATRAFHRRYRNCHGVLEAKTRHACLHWPCTCCFCHSRHLMQVLPHRESHEPAAP